MDVYIHPSLWMHLPANNKLNIIQFNAHPIISIFFFFQKEFQKNTESSAHIDIVWVSIWSIHLMFKYKVPEQACKYLDQMER